MRKIEINNRINMLKMLDRSGIEYFIDFDYHGAVTVYFTGEHRIAYSYGTLDNRFDSERVVYFGHDWALFGSRVLEMVQQIKAGE